MKRFLNMKSSELTELSREEFLGAIAGSEGRILVSETIGTVQPLLSDVTNAEFAASMGADIILMPAPGTVPGITTEYIRSLVNFAHSLGKLTMTSIGTSQEGADTDTIKRIALECKMTGTDLHHIGDSGYVGMALPENIMAYGIAVRGVRHTYHRMAQSILR